MEGVLATSMLESKLHKATSNSAADLPTTADLYVIADHTFLPNSRKKVIARVADRLQSHQKSKHRRLKKTLDLALFLLRNGSFEFISAINDRMKPTIAVYSHYELTISEDNDGFAI